MKFTGTVKEIVGALQADAEKKITEIDVTWDANDENFERRLWNSFDGLIQTHSLKKISFSFLPYLDERTHAFFGSFFGPFPDVLKELRSLEELDLSAINPNTVRNYLYNFESALSRLPNLKIIKLPKALLNSSFETDFPTLFRRLPAEAAQPIQVSPPPPQPQHLAGSGDLQQQFKTQQAVATLTGLDELFPSGSGGKRSSKTRVEPTPPPTIANVLQPSASRKIKSKKSPHDNWAMFKNDLRSFGRFLSKLPATFIGALFSIPMSIIIYNPVTCMVGALDGSNWKRYGIPLNIFFILISPLSSIVAFFNNLRDGAKLGYMKGFRAAATFPATQWRDAPFTTKEIVVPWAIAVIYSLPIIGVVAAVKLGSISIAAISKGSIIPSATLGGYVFNYCMEIAAIASLQLGAYAGMVAHYFHRGLRHWRISRENLFPSYYEPQEEMLPRQKVGSDPSYKAMESRLRNDPVRKTGTIDTFKINPHEEMTPCAVSRIFQSSKSWMDL